MKTMFAFGIRSAVLAASLTLVACGEEEKPQPQPVPTAVATLEPRNVAAPTNSTTAGTATFTEENGKVTLKLDVTGATPGQHGAHIHAVGDCSDALANNAGGHWNPDTMNHGSPDAPSHHIGDLGNITIGQDGKGSLTISMAAWKLGDGSMTDVVGKSVIIHANPDDFTTQPTGNSGPRVACGVIAKQ